jgi:hypothetical protein
LALLSEPADSGTEKRLYGIGTLAGWSAAT